MTNGKPSHAETVERSRRDRASSVPGRAVKFYTTSAYISGAICGDMWMPQSKGAVFLRADVRAQLNRFSDKRGATFEDVVSHVLMERGGDFQNARFTADTVLRVERRAVDAPGKYRVHVFERDISQLPGCADWVDAESYMYDFDGEEG